MENLHSPTKLLATRRELLKAAAAVSAVAAMPLAAFAAKESAAKTSVHRDHDNGDQPMNTVKTKDGVHIFYNDWEADSQ